jgi:lysozyme family protein
MDNFAKAFAIVVGIEAGLSTDPADPGNWTGGAVNVGVCKGTKYGISAAAYPNLDIANLTLDAAQALYRSDYWNEVKGDFLPWPLALLVFDCGVNQGVGIARTLMQSALGVQADGDIGSMTLGAAAASTTYHAARFMLLRVRRYQQGPNVGRYGDGWIIRCFIVCLKQGG